MPNVFSQLLERMKRVLLIHEEFLDLPHHTQVQVRFQDVGFLEYIYITLVVTLVLFSIAWLQFGPLRGKNSQFCHF